jgi:hypothetical protein
VPSDSPPNRGPVSRRRALTVGGAALLSALAATPTGTLDVDGDGADAVTAAAPSGDDVPTGTLDRIHARGVTGEGVHVGVLDPTGFDPGHPELTAAVRDVRAFGSSPAVVDRTSHGTAAAVTLARVAPDAALSLATFERPREFEAAVGWFRREDVDIVLAPVAAHGTDGGDPSPVSRAAADAAAAGVVLVAPTGNAARGHWEGTYHPARPARSDDRPRLRVRPLSGGGRADGRLVAWLAHRGGSPVDLDLDLALLRETEAGDGRQLVALSRPAGPGRGERLTADLDGGRHRLVVRPHDPASLPGDVGPLRAAVTTPTHRLVPARAAGSVAAPASAPGVLAVGAAAADGAAAYSGRGPTADGRRGVDLVAPPKPWVGAGAPGTSAAAARAAGVAALVASVLPGAASVRRLLRATAVDAGPTGPDRATGHGELAPLVAVRRARQTT